MKITKEMTIGEVVKNHPEVIQALLSFDMGCIGCPSAQAETLEEAAMVHGIDVDFLVEELNNVAA